MADSTFKKIELVGTSPNSFSEAVANAVAKLGESEKSLCWFEVVEERGAIAEGKIKEFQVTIRVGVKMS